MAGQPGRSVAVFGLAVVLLVLATIAVVVAAVVVASSRFASAASPWVSPLSVIKAGAINPALALGSLAGQDDQDIVDRAIAAGSADTALATLLYSTSLNDQTRANGLLRASRLLARQNRNEQALLVAHTAADVAMLSPTMTDYGRAAALDEAGQVMAQVGKKDEAASAYGMAATIALQSGRLDPAYRQLLIEGLAADYTRLGRPEQARALRGAAQPALSPDKNPAVYPGLLVPLIPGDSPAWVSLQAATAKRTTLTASLIAALQGQASGAPEPVRQALEKVLIEEDQLSDTVYSDGIAHSDNLLQRVAYARARVAWLTLKWRIARQGFGMALVPAWESQAREIEANLHKAFEDYYLILRDAGISLPGNVDAAQATVDIIQDQIKMGRLGMPPYAHEAELLSALADAWQQRINLGGVRLYITTTYGKSGTQLTVVGSQ